jgi:uncharacterized protein
LKFTLESTSAVSVRSVADGIFRIGEQSWSGPIALTADGVLEQWPAVSAAELSPATLAPLLDLSPELIIVGTGSGQTLPDRELMFAMARAGIGLEFMDTPAAARTFNVLVNEGRSVAAVMYPTAT